MPQHKSAKRRVRTSAKKKAQNRVQKSSVKTLIKSVREATTEAEAREALRRTTTALDRLAAKGVIHKNAAANKKSRLARAVDRLQKQS